MRESVPEGVHERLDELLLARWENHPEQPALVEGDRVVTAGELRDRVLRLAGALRERGVGDGDLVVVHLERSVDFVAAILAVVCAGGAHVAFDVADPPLRIRHMIDDCAPRLVLTSSALRGTLPADPACDIVAIDACEPDTVTAFTAAPGSADQPAVVIYTSGSTGRPKATLISHRAVVARLAALQRTHGLGGDDRMIHHTTCSFDMFLIEIYWPLLAGATVVIADPVRRRDADYLAEMIRDRGITTFYCVVSLLDLFLLARGPAERYDGLRRVLTGGEPLSPHLVRRFHERSTASLTNLYGPSECTIYCTAWECPRDPELDTVLIGSAVAGTTLRVMDPAGDPVPAGEPGELYIGGEGLGTGYLARPGLTAQRFVPDGLGRPGERLYRSGDTVRVLPGGALEFLGRTDGQVKLRGVRIELREIESVALRSGAVSQAAVVAEGSGPETRLVAFVVSEPKDARAGAIESVREAFRSWLPRSMVPAAVTAVDELPLTPNGKVDQSLLREWASGAVGVVPTDGPTTTSAIESLVSNVWCEVLRVPSLGPHEDFFDSGGDSFKVVRATERINSLLNVDLPMSSLLHAPTVAAFSQELSRLMKTAD
ncbi:non-ribosomal peptide synthetase [Streptomyces tsukubensis]|uniref:non-ribosomal peptide synthetase n=1 Tax=Streptomyces tsukubensis TaxID=83656 RepID=UPI0036B799BC